jgi:hypothetical protein
MDNSLIKRQAAIDALGVKPLAWTEGEYELGLQNQWEHDVNAIRALPSVQPKPKPECSCEQIKWERDMAIAQLNELGYGLGEKPRTGHWIEIAQYSDGKHKIECSECKGLIFSRGHANSFVVKNEYKFCPHCGVRMVEPQKRNDKE